VNVIAGSFHSNELSRMYTYLELSRFITMCSVSSQHGHRLKKAQHDGAWQHTQHPVVIFPGAKLSTIWTWASSTRLCIRRPGMRHAAADDDDDDGCPFPRDDDDVERDMVKLC